MIDFVRKSDTIKVLILFGRQTRSIRNNNTLKIPNFYDMLIENFKSMKARNLIAND